MNCPFEKEADTKHADAIPESLSIKLFNSIVKISLYSGEATGFFMKFKLRGKEKKFLFTCNHVINEEDIKKARTINIYYGRKNAESRRKIILDGNKRFIKTYKQDEEDVTFIEVLDEDDITEDK